MVCLGEEINRRGKMRAWQPPVGGCLGVGGTGKCATQRKWYVAATRAQRFKRTTNNANERNRQNGKPTNRRGEYERYIWRLYIHASTENIRASSQQQTQNSPTGGVREENKNGKAKMRTQQKRKTHPRWGYV